MTLGIHVLTFIAIAVLVNHLTFAMKLTSFNLAIILVAVCEKNLHVTILPDIFLPIGRHLLATR